MNGQPSEEQQKRGRGRPRLYDSEDERRAADRERKKQRRQEKRTASMLTPDAIEQAIAKTAGAPVNDPRALSLDDDLRELFETHPQTALALQYPRDVNAGKEDACKWVKLACERHENDMAAIGESPFVFDADKAERACKAVQMFREVKGPRSRERLRLSSWQLFIVASMFGWLMRDTMTRRFRMVLIYVPRGNGKSTMVAPIGLYMLSLDGEGGSEVYSAAVTREQARIVWSVAQNMALMDQRFQRTFGVEVGAHAIVQSSTASTFKPLSRDANSLDGLNVHCAILDELSQHKTRDVHDVLVTALGKRAQSMLIGITTCGSNQSGIGFEQWRYAQQVLEGSINDDSLFAMLYTIDETDDWTQESSWRKANPNWGVSVMPDMIKLLAEKAMQMSSHQNAFKQKHLNIWTNADVAWMDMRAWNACADPNMSVDSFAREECVIGLDLASKIDIAAKARLFRKIIDDKEHYFLFLDFWLPETAISESRNASYAGWEIDGYIHTTAGDTTDFGVIRDSIIADDLPNFHLRDVAYDPWQSLQLAKELESQGVPVIEYRATVANFSAPMKELEALVLDRRFHHDGNPVMSWMMSNVVCHYDVKDNIYPRKERPENKIDGPVATIMALGRMMSLEAMSLSHGAIIL